MNRTTRTRFRPPPRGGRCRTGFVRLLTTHDQYRSLRPWLQGGALGAGKDGQSAYEVSDLRGLLWSEPWHFRQFGGGGGDHAFDRTELAQQSVRERGANSRDSNHDTVVQRAVHVLRYASVRAVSGHFSRHGFAPLRSALLRSRTACLIVSQPHKQDTGAANMRSPKGTVLSPS